MPRKKAKAAAEQQPATNNGRQSVDTVVKNICDIMRRGNMAGAMQYVPELSWLLFLRILDDNEMSEQARKEAVDKSFSPSLTHPYRWRDWAAKDSDYRQELAESEGNALLDFVNNKLLPHLKSFADKQNASEKQQVIAQIVRSVEKTHFDNQRDMLEVLDRIDALRQSQMNNTHFFTLSQVYENLLLKMGEKNNDGGQFFTPREVVRAMVQVIDPQVGDTVYDPCCGTGGFLAQSFEYMKKAGGDSGKNLTKLRNNTFYGREKEKIAYPIALANLVLHGIDYPQIWHGNTLSRTPTSAALFPHEEKFYDVILSNPPFGGKEAKSAKTRYNYPTSSTQTLFMQDMIAALKGGGRCGVVMDEGFMFQTNQDAIVRTKRRLLEKCDLYCVVSLPGGVFSQAGAGVKTNLLFFTKGKPTEKIWYYDLSDVKVTKRQPLTLHHFKEFFELLPNRADSANSWTITADDIVKNNYDLKAKNPNKKTETDTRTPPELMAVIKEKTAQITAALDQLTKE
ncbi:MAG: N-6 DNA methylase [Gammaproteobacteria bacterium]